MKPARLWGVGQFDARIVIVPLADCQVTGIFFKSRVKARAKQKFIHLPAARLLAYEQSIS